MRIELLPVEEARGRAEAAGVPAYMADLNVFRTLLHHPPLAKAVNDLLAMLLFKGALSTRLRELLIMRLGWGTASEYEWAQHWRVALQLGVPESDVAAVRDWRGADCFDAADRAVLAATDDAIAHGAVTPATWAACEAVLPTVQERLELVAAIGNWHMVSIMLRSLEVPLEEGVEAWLPDGVPPGGMPPEGIATDG